MLQSEADDILTALNTGGAALTWDFNPVPSVLPLGTIISSDPPFSGEVDPHTTHIEFNVSDGTGTPTVGGFPAVSQFGGLLQGANG